MIHPTAIVSDTAKIADDVRIGPYSIIGDGVEIESGTRIDSHVVVNGPTYIGKDNHIYQFASVGDDPQDKKYADEPTTLHIGDRNTIREFCTISRGTTQDKGETVIGDDNWIMAYVHIAHDCVVGDKTIMANNATLAGHVHVGDDMRLKRDDIGEDTHPCPRRRILWQKARQWPGFFKVFHNRKRLRDDVTIDFKNRDRSLRVQRHEVRRTMRLADDFMHPDIMVDTLQLQRRADPPSR